MQAIFKTVGEYREWRAHWRARYRLLTSLLCRYKGIARRQSNKWEEIHAAQKFVALYRCEARAMMAAREAVKAALPLSPWYTEKMRDAA